MTPIENAEAALVVLERDIVTITPDGGRRIKLADVFRACIEGAKEENWAKFMYGGRALFEASHAKEFLPELKEESGFEFFQRPFSSESGEEA